MQQTELAAIQEAVRQGLFYPWWALGLALIGAAIGAFATSYLKRKGEDLASLEHFDDIRHHLKTTTKDTEEIKQLLLGEAWRTQRQWAAREQYYSDLLTQLHIFNITLSDLADYYMVPGSEHIADSLQGDNFQSLFATSRAAYQEVQRLLGPSAIFLSAEAVASLEQLASEHWGIAQHSLCTAEYVGAAQALASSTYAKVLSEAKRHLHLDKSDA